APSRHASYPGPLGQATRAWRAWRNCARAGHREMFLPPTLRGARTLGAASNSLRARRTYRFRTLDNLAVHLGQQHRRLRYWRNGRPSIRSRVGALARLGIGHLTSANTVLPRPTPYRRSKPAFRERIG